KRSKRSKSRLAMTGAGKLCGHAPDPRALMVIECLEIKTPRLVLEPLEVSHADELYDGLRDERLYEFIDSDPPESRERLRTRYAKLASRRSPDGTEAWLNWAIRECRTDRYVGFVQATVNASRSALIAYVLFHSAWGNGYGREAVAALIRQL